VLSAVPVTPDFSQFYGGSWVHYLFVPDCSVPLLPPFLVVCGTLLRIPLFFGCAVAIFYLFLWARGWVAVPVKRPFTMYLFINCLFFCRYFWAFRFLSGHSCRSFFPVRASLCVSGNTFPFFPPTSLCFLFPRFFVSSLLTHCPRFVIHSVFLLLWGFVLFFFSFPPCWPRDFSSMYGSLWFPFLPDMSPTVGLPSWELTFWLFFVLLFPFFPWAISYVYLAASWISFLPYFSHQGPPFFPLTPLGPLLS